VEKDKEILTLRRELDAATAAAPSGTAVGTVRILSEMFFFFPLQKADHVVVVWGLDRRTRARRPKFCSCVVKMID
jgi:hypothetical protein